MLTWQWLNNHLQESYTSYANALDYMILLLFRGCVGEGGETRGLTDTGIVAKFIVEMHLAINLLLVHF